MSTAPKNGGQAFPRGHFEWKDGMTLRDWFAGQAMSNGYTEISTAQEIAEWSYQIADAMIAARQKGGSHE